MKRMKNKFSFVLAVIMVMTFVLACIPMAVSATAEDDIAQLEEKKVFDLGLNFNGEYGTSVGSLIKDVSDPQNALYNEVSGGITLHRWYGTPGYDEDSGVEYFEFDTGTPQSQLGLSVIPFTMWQDGITLETYVKLEYGDDTNTDVFQIMVDARSNLNLLKLDYVFFGLNTGSDVLAETSIIPTGEWLHIVATQEDGRQAVFVNGVKVAEDEYDYDTSMENENQFWFGAAREEEDNIMQFNEIRLYAGAISDEGAELMYDRYLDELEPDVIDAFIDINPEGWYINAIKTVITEGLFGGISDTEFAPDMNMTRAMFVTVLSRLNGVDLEAYTPSVENPFTDINDGQWFYKAVL